MPDTPATVPTPPKTGRVILGVRLSAGVVGLAAAAAVILAVGFVPFPSIGGAPAGVTVTPQPAPEERVCPGAALRLGDAQGKNADVPTVIGQPALSVGPSGDVGSVKNPAAATASSASAPRVLTASAGVPVAGAQTEQPGTRGFTGMTAAACQEPSGSSWLVGGSTEVGRTTLLLLTNPDAVASTVTIELYGEAGLVSAPGLTGIEVPAQTQRVLSLAGFAPKLASPVVHVTARGGRIVANLQQSVVRGLDDGGTDVVSPGAVPATSVVVPGIRLSAMVSTSALTANEGWDDIAPAVRIAAPGDTEAKVHVIVTSDVDGQDASAFDTTVPPHSVVDMPLDAGTATESGAVLADGDYTVQVVSDQPVVAGVRASTAGTTASTAGSPSVANPVTGSQPPSDLAWFAAAPVLADGTLATIASAPSPVVTFWNPGTADATVTLAGAGAPLTLTVPRQAAASIPVTPGASYTLSGVAGMSAQVSFVAPGMIAGYPFTSPGPGAEPITVYP